MLRLYFVAYLCNGLNKNTFELERVMVDWRLRGIQHGLRHEQGLQLTEQCNKLNKSEEKHR